MSFVSIVEFQTRYENTIPAADQERVAAFLQDACALVSDIVGSDVTDGWDEVPGGVVTVVCAAVRRAYENPNGYAGETIGDYAWRGSAAAAAAGVYFTPAEVRTIRRAAGSSSVTTVELEGMLPNTIAESQYVADAGSPAAPILYYDAEDVLP